jgi:hypothetical protein
MKTGTWQEWLTLRGASASYATITQGEACYVDLADYDDVIAWVDVKEVTGTVTLSFQSSPTADDAAFVDVGTALTLSASTTPIVVPLLAAYQPTPLARFLRWQLTGSGGTYDVTFRLLFAAYAPGG